MDVKISKYKKHQIFLKKVMKHIQTNYPDVRFWQNTTGAGRSLTGGQYIAFGLKGSSDIIGIMPCGKFLGIEIKTGKARQSKNQVAFQNMIEKNNGLYLLVKDNDEIDNQIKTLKEIYLLRPKSQLQGK